MKFLGTNRPGTARARSLVKFSWSRAALVAAACATLAGIAACIPAGDCTGDCADAVGTTGGSSGSGGKPGGSGGGAKASPPSDLAIADCSAHPTLAEVESAIIVKTCGIAVCHGKSTDTATDMKTAGIAMRMLNAKPKVLCQDDKLIDPDAPEKSIFLRKLEEGPKCNNGSEAGEKMPGTGSLSDDDKKCLTNYVKAISDWSKM